MAAAAFDITRTINPDGTYRYTRTDTGEVITARSKRLYTAASFHAVDDGAPVLQMSKDLATAAKKTWYGAPRVGIREIREG